MQAQQAALCLSGQGFEMHLQAQQYVFLAASGPGLHAQWDHITFFAPLQAQQGVLVKT
jgi:hypothetical protein